jgi:tellurium resistance protein TerD
MQEVINLSKGQTIDLRKNSKGESVYDLSQITIGLGWDVAEKYELKQVPIEQTFLEKISGKQRFENKKIKVEEDFDLDAIAFLLDSDGKVSNLGKEVIYPNGIKVGLKGSDIIFFNNMTFPSGTGTSQMLYPEGTEKSIMVNKVRQLLNSGEIIVHTGDNLTGEGEGDDEQIIVKLNSLPPRIHKILFLVCIYHGQSRNQHFGQVDNAFIRACDANGKEITRYSLSNSPELNGMRSMIFGEMYRYKEEWKFRAIGNPETTDNFVEILKRYLNSN